MTQTLVDIEEAKRLAASLVSWLLAERERMGAELAAARDALGVAWTQSGATLAEGIVAKTKFLERLGAFEFHPRSKWHEDIGDVVWWRLPVAAPPYVGTPGDSGWVDVYTHFSRLPSNDEIESAETAAGVTRG